MESINYMQMAMWVHCLRCHKNVHVDDSTQHFYKTCTEPRIPAGVDLLCLCLRPDFNFVPEREGLTWE